VANPSQLSSARTLTFKSYYTNTVFKDIVPVYVSEVDTDSYIPDDIVDLQTGESFALSNHVIPLESNDRHLDVCLADGGVRLMRDLFCDKQVLLFVAIVVGLLR